MSSATETPTSTSTSPAPTTISPVQSTSKLQPAPTPLVSAWGKKPSSTPSTTTPAPPPTTSTTSTTSGTKAPIHTQHWPSAEAALESTAAKETTEVSPANSSKQASSAVPKVKSTGKEKWVPYEATIVISSGNHKKKNNNNNNSSNNNSNKRKQNQGKQQQNSGKAKDNRNKRSVGDSNNKKSNNNNGVVKSEITKGVEDLKITSSSSSIQQNENGTKKESSVPVDPLEQNNDKFEPAEAETISLDSAQDNKPETPASSVSSSAQIPQIPPQPQDSHQNNNKKKFQHRNSEPAAQFNNNGQPYLNYNNNNNHKGGRRFHPNNKNNYNNYRHSIAGAGNYQNFPILTPFNYGYVPFLNPSNITYPNVNTYHSPISRSNSASPQKDQYVPLNTNAAVPAATGGAYHPVVGGFPYVEDPLTLIVNQLSYYFSIENLLKDFYLRKQMNSQGFVPLAKLIEFNRLNALTGGDIQLLQNAVGFLPHLEQFEGKIRVRENWQNWILPYEQRHDAGKEDNENFGSVTSP